MRDFASVKYLMLYPLNTDRRCKDKEVVRAPVLFAREMPAAAGELIQNVCTSNIIKNMTARERHSEQFTLDDLCD